jgi:hypothetical protein
LKLGNIDRFITKRIERKEKNHENRNNAINRSISIPTGNWTIIIIGIVIAAIGFAGAIYYGSQFVKEEVNVGGQLPYTNPSPIKNILPIDLEIVFVVICIIGFGIFTYGFATRVDKPLDFYPI